MKAAKNRAKRQGRIQGGGGGGGGGAKGAEAPPPPPPPLQVNEMCNILFGQNINSHLRKMSIHCMNLHIKISKMPQKAFMRISDIDFLLNGTKSGLFIVSYKH